MDKGDHHLQRRVDAEEKEACSMKGLWIRVIFVE